MTWELRGHRPTRRRVLQTGTAAGAALLLPHRRRLLEALAAGAIRPPNSLPDPSRPAGTPDSSIPINHVVVVMMENHSFDNYLGLLPHRGRPAADGFRLDSRGRIDHTNPTSGGVIRSFRMPSLCQMESEPNQSWGATHKAIDGGTMQGFVAASGDVAMGYWDEPDIPFYYSLARTFPLANRWFASCPGQTYPNRRFLACGTAFGEVATITPGPTDQPPANGTIYNRYATYGVTWTDYFTDLPTLALIPADFEKYAATNTSSIAAFHAAAAAGTLPNVSYVDPDFGIADVAGGVVPGQPVPQTIRAQGQDEENPQNIRFGEQFVSSVVNSVMQSPHWGKGEIMMIWVYDEHGGYYDHVPPPPAIPPDSIPPAYTPFIGGYDMYGVRVPAVVISPWAKAGYVSPVVHDHTSILAFIERKWNLPACTFRDANADELLDFFDFSHQAFATPPVLAAPADPIAADQSCTTADPHGGFEPYSTTTSGGSSSGSSSAAGAAGRLPNTADTGVRAEVEGAVAAALAVAAWLGRRARQAGALLGDDGPSDPGDQTG